MLESDLFSSYPKDGGSMVRNFKSEDRKYSESLASKVMKKLVEKYRDSSFTKVDVREEDPTISTTNIDRLVAYLIKENQVIEPAGSSRNPAYTLNMTHATCVALLDEVEADAADAAEMEAAKVSKVKKGKKEQKQKEDAENDENSSNGEQKRSSTDLARDHLLSDNEPSKKQRISPSHVDSLQHLSDNHSTHSCNKVQEKEEEEEEVDEEAELEKARWKAKQDQATDVLTLAMCDEDACEANDAFEYVKDDMSREEFDQIVNELAERNIVMVCDNTIVKI